MTPPPEKLALQVVDMHRRLRFQFLASLPRPQAGWFANRWKTEQQYLRALARRALVAIVASR